MLRHVALGDGDEAGEARFRRQQVVEGAVQTARAFCVREPVADREDAAPAIVEEVEPHAGRERRGALRQALERGVLRVRRLDVHGRNGVHGRVGPEGDLARVRLRRCAGRGERRGRLRKLAGQHRERRRIPAGERPAHVGHDVARHTMDLSGGVATRTRSRARRRRQREQIGGVDDALEPLLPGLRARGKRHQTLRERDQRRGEIAAVDRRDVARVERRQRLGAVPVEKMALVAFETFERGQRAIETIDQRRGRHVPEIVRRERRQQRHADVGRRRAPRQPRLVTFLVVVRRQPPVRVRDERLVIAPGLARRPAQQQPLAFTERTLSGTNRLAQPVGDHRRADPQRDERQRRRQRLAVRRRDQKRGGERDDRARDHVGNEPEERASADDAGGARRGRRGRFPFEQPTLRDRQPDERQHDRVRGIPRVIGEERHAERDLREGDRGVGPQVAPEHGEGLRSARPDDHLCGQRQQPRRHHHEHGRGPEPVRPRERDPSGDEQREQHRGDEAAAQVVQDLPA